MVMKGFMVVMEKSMCSDVRRIMDEDDKDVKK